MSATGAAVAGRSHSSDTVSLAERMGYFQLLRAALAIIVLGSALFAPQVLGSPDLSAIALITGGYLVTTGVAEGLRRLISGRGLALVTLMLLIDGVYLAWMMYQTNGIQSPLRFLTYVHLVAVTLLASYRTGLKIALWHSLLLFVVYYAQLTGFLAIRGSLEPGGQFDRLAVFNVSAFWLVALGTALFSTINERELRKRKHELEVFTDTVEELERITDARAIAKLSLDRIVESFGFKRGVVLGGQGGDLQLMAYRGPGEPEGVAPGEDALLKEAWAQHQPVLKKKPDPDENPQLASLLPFARNLIVVPMYAEGQPMGAMILEHANRTPRVEKRVVEMLRQFGSHASLAIGNAWLLNQVQKMADTDALTGVANRRVFEQSLAREMARAERHGEPVTLVMIDVDHFKSFNDAHGHQEGDNVLRAVGDALHEASREFDIVARYGGEEFAVILPACSAKESLVVAERLRKSISDIKAPAPVTASAGVATFPNHAADSAALIRSADEALYESKRAGRDRVTRSRRRAHVRTSPVPAGV